MRVLISVIFVVVTDGASAQAEFVKDSEAINANKITKLSATVSDNVYLAA